jgi:hypothetical protein
MTSYDKVVKLACKPKAAPPKAKVRHILFLCRVNCVDDWPSSIWTPSLLQLGLRMVQYMTSAKLLPPGFENPMQ